MMKCPACGFEMADGNVFCEKCGTKLVTKDSISTKKELEKNEGIITESDTTSTGATCPQCGKPIHATDTFCEHCGYALQQRECNTKAPRMEVKPAEEFSTIPPTAPPSVPKGPSWFARHKKKVLGSIIGILLLVGAAVGGKIYLDYNYITKTVSLSTRITAANKSLVENVQHLSKASSEEERNTVIAAIKDNQKDLSGIIQDNNGRWIPGKFTHDAEAINDFLHQQETIYADVAFVIDNPTDSQASDKIDDLNNTLKTIKEVESSIHISGADFTVSRDMDNLANYLNVYKKALSKEALEKQRQSIANKNTNVSKGSADLSTPDGTFRKYHQYLTNHNLQQAYNLFSPNFKAEVSYDGWAGGYSSTISSEPTRVQVVSNSGSQAILNFTLKARDRMEDGGVYVKIYDGTCELRKNDGMWQIYSVSSDVKNEYKE